MEWVFEEFHIQSVLGKTKGVGSSNKIGRNSHEKVLSVESTQKSL